MPPRPTLRAMAAALLHPHRPEERAAVARVAERLPPAARARSQTLGAWTAGCAATRGVHEACDLACTACYRSPDAQATPPLPRAEVERQFDTIRAQLGPGGHVQLTAGEVTLLPIEELVALVRAARARQLVPMLMTNGVRLLDEPELLVRLVLGGGLRHLAVHVDATQRGRRGWRDGQPESAWHAERDRVARLVHGVRARTGVRLRVAHTLTVTPGTAADVADVLRFVLARSDAFFMLSLQPAAGVGITRTRDARRGDDAAPAADAGRADPVWPAVESVVGRRLDPRGWLYGHPDCSQVAPLLAVRAGDQVRALPLVRAGSRLDRHVVGRLLGGGLAGWTRHGEHDALAFTRLAGRLLRDPALLVELPAWAAWRALLAAPAWLRLAAARLRGRPAWCAPFTVVVHRFMDAAALDTPRGRERLRACAFRVPVEGEMIPMCALNATGLRRRLDAADRQRARPVAPVAPEVRAPDSARPTRPASRPEHSSPEAAPLP